MVERLKSSRLVRPGLLLLSLLLAASLLLAKGQGQKPDKPPPDDKGKKEGKKEPASRRIFTGQVALKSSHQESATMGAGIKGVDENGQVAKDVLARQPGAEHYQKVAQLGSWQVPADELAAFLQQANLRRRGGSQ
ncbi:MAG: hypothetical protein L0212_08245 [Acidobacteria bacterium]|nr:hypothetical protein [Acidobacteriota bacterium]